MENNRENLEFGKDPGNISEGNDRFDIADDSDTLEPFVDGDEQRIINTDSETDILKWANEFQISTADLKAAIVLNGNSVRAIKKYLSV